jgi:hypothetical protein
VVQRKCGTCRFFQDAGIACSGWCTHPNRGDLHDLVLVRRAELACRNSWDRDLWEPAGQRQASLTRSAGRVEVPRLDAVPDNPTDRVTSISVSKLKQLDAKRTKHPAVAGGQDVDVQGEVRGAGNPQIAGRRSKMSHASSIEPSFPMALRGGRASSESVDDQSTTSRPTLVVHTYPNYPPNPPTPRAASTQSATARRQPSSPASGDTSPLPTEELNRIAEQGAHTRRTPVDGLSTSSISTARASNVPLVHVDGLDREVSLQQEAFSSAATAPDSVSRAPSPLDAIPWVASIPRCCDTCRDYRREPDGDTGYCGNADAFPNQTVVKSHELACRSSFGVFWLPSDEAWLDQAEISHHTRPTPYLDDVLAELGPDT